MFYLEILNGKLRLCWALVAHFIFHSNEYNIMYLIDKILVHIGCYCINY